MLRNILAGHDHELAFAVSESLRADLSLWDTAPKYLLLDRDAIYGAVFQRRVARMASRRSSAHPGVLGKILTWSG